MGQSWGNGPLPKHYIFMTKLGLYRDLETSYFPSPTLSHVCSYQKLKAILGKCLTWDHDKVIILSWKCNVLASAHCLNFVPYLFIPKPKTIIVLGNCLSWDHDKVVILSWKCNVLARAHCLNLVPCLFIPKPNTIVLESCLSRDHDKVLILSWKCYVLARAHCLNFVSCLFLSKT